jgi:transcriptional regulator with XRE-family HTH domain
VKQVPRQPAQRAAFAARLRTLREAAGLSVAELASRAALQRQTVYKLEGGEREPSLVTAVALARALGHSVAVFE